uniref:transposase n=1 Tax=Brevibacterium sp. 2SA TaxID=2502198 RepID=UPI001BB1E083
NWTASALNSGVNVLRFVDMIPCRAFLVTTVYEKCHTPELGLSKETLRVWVRKHKDSGKATPTESVDLEAENRRLRAELAEAKRANEILKRASAFFAAELDRPSK